MCIKCQNRLCCACIRKTAKTKCFYSRDSCTDNAKEKCNELKLDIDECVNIVNNKEDAECNFIFT